MSRMTRFSLRDDDTIASLQQEAAHASDPAYKKRIRVIIALAQGSTHRALARGYGVAKSTITDWVGRYTGGGVEALKLENAGCSKGHVVYEQAMFDDLAQEIDKGEGVWTEGRMVAWIQAHKKLTIRGRTITSRIAQLGYSSRGRVLGWKRKSDG